MVEITTELNSTKEELKIKSAALAGSLANATDMGNRLEKAMADLAMSRARVLELVAAKQEVDDELKRERLDQVELETKINELQKKVGFVECEQATKMQSSSNGKSDQRTSCGLNLNQVLSAAHHVHLLRFVSPARRSTTQSTCSA